MFDDDWGVSSRVRSKNNETDKLMRLAAPGERLALGALILFVLAVAAASFASVNRNLSLDGELRQAGAGEGWQASVLAASAITRTVESGMVVRVEVVAPSGAVLVLPGEVVAPSSGMSGGEPHLPDADPLRMVISVDADSVPAGVLESALPDGSPCRVIIPLGRQSMARALLSA